MALRLYNTLTRTKEEFEPLRRNQVGIYVCGPTVYGHSHLGHAKSYVSFDVIVRYLRYRGYSVLYVQNITDVGHLLGDSFEGEDRLVRQGKLEQKHPMQIAETYTRSYFEDMDALGNVRPDISPRATGHISEQIALIEMLLQKGMAYMANGSVYYDVRSFPEYGRLSGRVVQELEAGARVDVNPEKRNPQDFALWKKAGAEHIMQWPSPWGMGFPGWHIECSAMSMKYLGDSFDIHGGGLENQFPHHECEIAQSEGATGRPFAKYWIHNNMVTVNGQKMGKSLGNFTTLKDAFLRWPPQVIRFFILQSHYRSTLDFSDDAVNAAARGLERLGNAVRALEQKIASSGEPGADPGIDLERYRQAFLAAMDDDFNAPQAIAVLFDLGKEVNTLIGSGAQFRRTGLVAIDDLFGELATSILGISPPMEMGAPSSVDASFSDELIRLVIEIRKEVRAQKLWSLADTLRDGLQKIGVVLEDTKDGTTWKKVS
jgi:cysteinyl-tRNA synthetase